jgi:colanic acid biosynthesis glycosyl transferase WcaI
MTAPLRIAYVVQQFPPEVGAGPARVTEMGLRWVDQGARVTVLTGMPARAIPGRAFGEGDPAYRGKTFVEESWQGLRVLRSWSFKSTKPGFMGTVANNVSFMATAFGHGLARLGDVDVLIASSPPLFPHIAGAALARMRGIPLVLEARDLWPDYLVDMGMLRQGSAAARALFALERRLLHSAAHIVVVTESFRRRVISKGAAADRVDVLPNGVDVAKYRADAQRLPALAHRADEFLVGYLGNFGEGQDLSTIVDAAAIVARRDPTVRIVLAGDGPARQRVAAKATEAGIANLSVLPSIPKEDTRAFYNSCDVCLVPLAPVPVFQETVPSKIFEIMACERPVLASLDGEGRRIVEKSGAGVVVAPGDASAIAEAMLLLKALPATARADMGQRGRAFVSEHYDRGRVADRYLQLLRTVAAAAKQAPT